MEEKKTKKYVSDNAQLMEQWDWTKNIGLSPYEITHKSDKKAWWICDECGHSWESCVKNRSNGRGCPICARKKGSVALNASRIASNGSLAEQNPLLSKQWHPIKNGELTPNDVTSKSAKKVWWKCEFNHEWEAAINNRSAGKGCPICAGQKVQIGYNDLGTVNSDLAKEWNVEKNYPLTPQMVTANARKKVWWKCKHGHEWESAIYSRNVGFGCPYCSGRLVINGVTDLVTTHPSVAKEWHSIKNGKVKPNQVSIGMHKKVWWKCEKGHEWEAAIYSRRHSGCPICSSESKTSFPEQAIFYYLRQITKVYNRYQIKTRTEIDIYAPNLKLGIEYDGAHFHKGKVSVQREMRKNNTLSELGVTLIRVKETDFDEMDTENVLFCKRYPNDAELNRVINKVLYKINDITSNNFEIDVNVTRDRSAIYEQYVQSEKENSLLFANPTVALEWHSEKNGELSPLMVTPNSNKKVWWKCKNGHEWQAVVRSRNGGYGCPYCSGLKVVSGENDLATINPNLISEWNYEKNKELMPDMIAPNSNKKVWWKCKKGHEWEAVVSSRNVGYGCPYCSNVKVLKGYNDLTTTNPELCREWCDEKNEGVTPDMFSSGSAKKAWWHCGICGNEWYSAINKRVMGRGCPECAKKKRAELYVLYKIRENGSLASVNPALAEEWHRTKNKGLEPTQVTCMTNKKVWWKCKVCGCEWESMISNRSRGQGCPKCTKNRK